MGRLEFTFIIIAASCCLVSTAAAIEEVLDPTMEVAPSTELALSPAPGKCYCPLPSTDNNPCKDCKTLAECNKQKCSESRGKFPENSDDSDGDPLIPKPLMNLDSSDKPPVPPARESIATCSFDNNGKGDDCSCDSNLFSPIDGGVTLECAATRSYKCEQSHCIWRRGDGTVIPLPPTYKDNVPSANQKFTKTFGFGGNTKWPACKGN